MKPRNQMVRHLAFDASCRGCLQRIHARQDRAVEVVSDDGFHRGWAHADCVDLLEPDDPPPELGNGD